MKTPHIILRAATPLGADLAAAARPRFSALDIPTDPVGPRDLEIDVDELSPGDLVRLAGERGVEAIAPVMPMRLIEPLDVAAVAPAAPGIEWGIRAVGADTSPHTGAGVTVAVLDTGIDPQHPAFAGVTLQRQNFTGDANPNDAHGHGTHCAGTIFGRDIQGRRIGVASGVTRALIGKVLGANGGSSDWVVRGINWAVDQGAQVISMSLGVDFAGAVDQIYRRLPRPPQATEKILRAVAAARALEDYRLTIRLFETLAQNVAARAAFNAPCVVVAAAGNESHRGIAPDFEVFVSPPAAAPGFISVGALGESPAGWRIAPFSNTGANLSGPGVDIVSAAPGGGLTSMSGTSMATPHVAGVAALWIEELRGQNALHQALLEARLRGAATSVGIAPGESPADYGLGMICSPP